MREIGIEQQADGRREVRVRVRVQEEMILYSLSGCRYAPSVHLTSAATTGMCYPSGSYHESDIS